MEIDFSTVLKDVHGNDMLRDVAPPRGTMFMGDKFVDRHGKQISLPEPVLHTLEFTVLEVLTKKVEANDVKATTGDKWLLATRVADSVKNKKTLNLESTEIAMLSDLIDEAFEPGIWGPSTDIMEGRVGIVAFTKLPESAE